MNLILLGGSNWFYEIWNTLWLWVCSGIYYFIGILYQVFEKVASVNLFSEEIFEKLTGRMYLIIGIAMLFILAYNIILAIINPDGKDKGTSQMTKVVKETIISLVAVVLLPTIFNYMYIFQTHILESNIIGTIILGGTGSSGSGGNCEPTDYDCICEFPSGALSSYNNFERGWFFIPDTSTSDATGLLEATCKSYKGLSESTKGAYMVAPSVFSAFYRPTQFDFEECSDHIMGYSTSSVISGDPENEKICVNFFADILLSKYTGNITPFVNDYYLTSIISDSEKNGVYMEFHWIMAIVAGILALYMFFCYAMEIGVRVAKLGFLQLISPIPVMMRIIPGQKEKIYKKWFDNLKDAYIDVFIRLAIIYFALFGISLVPDVMSTMWGSVWSGENYTGLANLVKPIVSVFVILGLLKFAQDAPKLFKEFFGGSGKFALKSPKKQFQENKLAMGAAGAIGAGLSTMQGNIFQAKKDGLSAKKTLMSGVGGLIGGARRGAVRGFKTNNFSNLKGEIRQAKYESDAARARRQDNKKHGNEILNDLGIDTNNALLNSPVGSGLVGLLGAGDRLRGDLKSFVVTDGSSKVSSNAANLVVQHLDALESEFKKTNIKDLEQTRQKLRERFDVATPGDKFSVGNQTFLCKGDKWEVTDAKEHTKEVDFNKAKKIGEDEMKIKERELYVENYKKNLSTFQQAMDNIFIHLNDNISKMGDNANSIILNAVNDVKFTNSSGTEVKLSDQRTFSNIIEMKTFVDEKIQSGETKDLELVHEIYDTIKGKTKSIGSNIRFSDATVKDDSKK